MSPLSSNLVVVDDMDHESFRTTTNTKKPKLEKTQKTNITYST
jgi:hypothetical protein